GAGGGVGGEGTGVGAGVGAGAGAGADGSEVGAGSVLPASMPLRPSTSMFFRQLVKAFPVKVTFTNCPPRAAWAQTPTWQLRNVFPVTSRFAIEKPRQAGPNASASRPCAAPSITL